ncbi:hypothetical protein AWM68_17490 [Fictibacillus phosphorivorans]|uniref:Uncharacterized protein n=1 Tax=Fictibacillus phosphorivorans TaxID=1221500 RepID=A0A161RUN8_9BACL|nr:hypothetical protein [Fictibacillus phosphorivorans]KZE67966.1 hypothetical protein AWM68_17490 [Fictibacillus phosphorivorans]
MRESYQTTDKKFRFGKHAIKITSYHLTEHRAGVRVEVRRFTRTQTVEIDLLIGDDSLLLKRIYRRKAIQNATKKQVDIVVNEMIEYAKEKRLIKVHA